MFEFRLRILEAGPGEYTGVVDGFPDFLVTGTSMVKTEHDLVAALIVQLQGLLRYGGHRLWLDEFPTVHEQRLILSPRLR
jgi:hypothetical protein